MRSLRDSVIAAIVSVAVVGSLFGCRSVGRSVAASRVGSLGADNPYCPLAVGNTWSYRCSVEGEPQFDKTVALVALVRTSSGDFFKVETTVGKDRQPLVTWYFADATGNVYSSMSLTRNGAELLMPAHAKAGQSVGSGFTVAAIRRTHAPAVGEVDALCVENFSAEDPALTADKRAEWRGRFYVKGVGLIAEADGLGGESVLVKCRVRETQYAIGKQ